MDGLDEPRRLLVEELRRNGIADERVLAAIGTVRREAFVPGDLAERAYENVALPIGLGQTISQPYVVALMTQELGLSGSERVLEVGTGSGYQAAILASLAREVVTVERMPGSAGGGAEASSTGSATPTSSFTWRTARSAGRKAPRTIGSS